MKKERTPLSMLTAEEKAGTAMNPPMLEPKIKKQGLTMAQVGKVRANDQEIPQDEWVDYGTDNNYFEWLALLYQNSPTNNACVYGKTLQLYGKGLYPISREKVPQKYAFFASRVNQGGVFKVCLDYTLYGMAAIIVRRRIDGSLKSLDHWPMHTLRLGLCNADGEITRVFYASDWSKVKKNDNVKSYPTYGHDEGEMESIYIISAYTPGRFYYTPPPYMGGTLWAALEWEVSKFYNSYVKKGMYPMWLVNMNNGVPSEEEQDQIETKISTKYQGTEGDGFILAFNDSAENAATLQGIEIPDAPGQFEFLSGETTEKVMLAHNITSPLLLGIRDSGGGLGSNANELKQAFTLFTRNIIEPMQGQVIQAYEKIMSEFDFFHPLGFIPNMTPAELMLRSQGVELSEIKSLRDKTHDHGHMTEEDEVVWMEYLEGIAEYPSMEEWDVVETQVVTDPNGEQEATAHYLAAASAAYENPEDKSAKGDSGLYKVRYRYMDKPSDKSRSFCKYMCTRQMDGAMYRLEDIVKMGKDGVNGQFAPKGESKYSIWEWKGGVYCHHYWERVVLFRKRNADGTFKPASSTGKMENDKEVSAESAIDAGVPAKVLKPKAWRQANTRPIDTPSRGRLNFNEQEQ